MKIRLKFFARAAELADGDQHEIDMPDGSKVGDLRGQLGKLFPKLDAITPSLLIAIGTDYVTDDSVLADDVEVVCFPPVSGG